MADIEIAVEPPKPLTVKLGKNSYKVRPIKGSLGVALAQRLQGADGDLKKLQSGMTSLIETIFGKTDAATILKRINDPEDALDYTHITDLLNALIEKSSGNPTT